MDRPFQGVRAEDERACWGQAQSNAAPRGPGQSSGPCRLQAGTKHNTTAGPAAYHITEFDGYPPSAAGVLASARARPILLGASGPFDGLAHEPRRHGVRLACVVFPWTLRRARRPQLVRRQLYDAASLLLHTVLAMDDDRPADPAASLCMKTGRSELVFKLALVSLVLVGPKLTQRTGHVSCRSRAASPLRPCSPQSWP